MTTYLDCNATTPIDSRVRDLVLLHLTEEFGNAGSRTHEFGTRAKQAVEKARRQVAAVLSASPDEVTFTGGATESNNLAILGLAKHLRDIGKLHLVTSGIEHKAVLEPFEELQRNGFELTVLSVGASGLVDPDALRSAMRPDTGLVSIMHANNETGVIQPLAELCAVLAEHRAYFHVDAAQGFGKELGDLSDKRIDLISASGHKVYAPKGIGALVARRRGYQRAPLQPLQFGGGQERGLRPGTSPVHLIAGLGLAAELATTEAAKRSDANRVLRQAIVEALAAQGAEFNGDQQRCQSHVLNFSLPGINSEAVMVNWKGLAAVSNGSACTSHSYTPSHVLTAMGLAKCRIDSAIRMSWCHLTPMPDLDAMVRALRLLR